VDIASERAIFVGHGAGPAGGAAEPLAALAAAVAILDLHAG